MDKNSEAWVYISTIAALVVVIIVCGGLVAAIVKPWL